jgi:hypothetical protein
MLLTEKSFTAKLYREEINNKIKSKTQPAKKRAKGGPNERSWSYRRLVLPTMHGLPSLGAFLGGLRGIWLLILFSIPSRRGF